MSAPGDGGGDDPRRTPCPEPIEWDGIVCARCGASYHCGKCGCRSSMMGHTEGRCPAPPLVRPAAPRADEGAEPSLHIVRVCELCACGAGGECHVPGCAFWMHDAPTGDTLAAIAGQVYTRPASSGDGGAPTDPYDTLHMLDVFLALGGTDEEFAEWIDGRAFADAWPQLVAAVAGRIDSLRADSNPPAGVLLKIAERRPAPSPVPEEGPPSVGVHEAVGGAGDPRNYGLAVLPDPALVPGDGPLCWLPEGRWVRLLAAGSTEADETQRYDPQPHWLIPVATPEQGKGPAK